MGWWIVQMLIVVPIPVMLVAHIGVILVDSMAQTLADGGSAALGSSPPPIRLSYNLVANYRYKNSLHSPLLPILLPYPPHRTLRLADRQEIYYPVHHPFGLHTHLHLARLPVLARNDTQGLLPAKVKA